MGVQFAIALGLTMLNVSALVRCMANHLVVCGPLALVNERLDGIALMTMNNEEASQVVLR